LPPQLVALDAFGHTHGVDSAQSVFGEYLHPSGASGVEEPCGVAWTSTRGREENQVHADVEVDDRRSAPLP
jgi:hypothetical protein